MSTTVDTGSGIPARLRQAVNGEDLSGGGIVDRRVEGLKQHYGAILDDCGPVPGGLCSSTEAGLLPAGQHMTHGALGLSKRLVIAIQSRLG